MIRVAIVGGLAVDALVNLIDKKNFVVEKKYKMINELWDDIIAHGNSAFLDIDKIVVMGVGFINSMPYEEQILNLQSVMLMENLRSILYIMVKDSDLYHKIEQESDKYIIYRNFNMLLMKELTAVNLDSVLKGYYDAHGLFHPDFLRRNEIDAMLDSVEEKELEKVEEKEEKKVETFDKYVDNEEVLKEIKRKQIEDEKERRKKEIEERRARSRQERMKKNKENEEKKESSSGKLGLINRLFGGRKQKEDTEKGNVEAKVENEGTKDEKEDKKAGKSQKSKASLDLYRGVIAVTGDRQSGISTTVANMAEIYAKNGNSVLIIDLDIKRRMQPLLFKRFEEAIELDSRVAHGLLVSLVNPKNLESVYSVVSDNIAVLSISPDAERYIKKFANRPIGHVFTAANMVNLLSLSKSLFDVVIIDFPFEALKEIGECLSYVDKVVMCIPNTTYHLDMLLEIELEDLFMKNEIIAYTLMSKTKILLTKYNNLSKMHGKEMTPELVMDTLSSLEESFYHVEVIGKIPYSIEYEKQFEKDNRIVKLDNEYRQLFEEFMQKI